MSLCVFLKTTGKKLYLIMRCIIIVTLKRTLHISESQVFAKLIHYAMIFESIHFRMKYFTFSNIFKYARCNNVVCFEAIFQADIEKILDKGNCAWFVENVTKIDKKIGKSQTELLQSETGQHKLISLISSKPVKTKLVIHFPLKKNEFYSDLDQVVQQSRYL